MLDLKRVVVLGALLGLGLANSCKQRQNDKPEPNGNPTKKPSLGDIVPVGEPYEISWNPTTKGSISIVLLRGPSENAVEYICIAESVPNSGSFSWTPPKSLEDDKTHYGIKLIVDEDGDKQAKGDYQYTPQFGISNPRYNKDDKKEDEKKDEHKKGDSKKDGHGDKPKKEHKPEHDEEGTSTKYVSSQRTHTKTRSHTKYCSHSPCPGPSTHTQMPYPTGGQNSTLTQPTSVSSRPSAGTTSKTTSKSKTKSKSETKSESKSKTKTSTTVKTSTVPPSSTNPEVEFTTTQATPVATPPPIVTAEPSSPPVEESNTGTAIRFASVMFAGVAAVAWFVL